MIYAGIGSRQTPKPILDIMNKFGRFMAKNGHVLRSGGASGADLAFEIGAIEGEGKTEIYLPWEHFNNSPSKLFPPSREATSIAMKFHPAWSRLSPAAQKLMARNSHQILGQDLKSPCDFVVCWTKDGYNLGMARGIESGGTGQAIEIALCHNVKVYNLSNKQDMNDLRARTEEFTKV